MYSSSILYVYEGDEEALEIGIQSEARREVVDGDDEDSEMEEVPQYLSKTKLIDFAHAAFRQGQGPDHNVLPGIKKILEHLDAMNV